MTRILILLAAVLSLTSQQTVFPQEGYSISLSVKGGAGKTMRLGYHLGREQYVRDSIVADGNGKCTFSGKEKLPHGVWLIVFPDNRYSEFLIEDNQAFSIKCDISDVSSTLVFEGSPENEKFVAYQREWKRLQEEAMDLSSKLKSASPGSAEASAASASLSEMEKSMKSFLRKTWDDNKTTLLGAIARSIIPVETPVPTVPQNVANRDSVTRLWGYLSYKQHYFDNIDFNQPGLIRSPVLGTRLDQFFSEVVIQAPDSIIKEADRVLKMSEANSEMYQYIAVWLFNRYAASQYMGHDAVIVHLADEIYLSGKATWVTDEYKSELAAKVERLRPNLIGQKAHDMVMNSFGGIYVSLYDVNAEFTIVYFWEPDCGHCKEATPKLRDYYTQNKGKGIEVFAVCTQRDREKWEKYISDNNLTWINGWDPDRVSRFDLYYNVDSTPLVYILDREKNIIAKRLSVEDIGSFIDNYRKMRAVSQRPSSGR